MRSYQRFQHKYKEVIEKIKPHLNEYISLFDRNPENDKFSCINPAHPDKNPSCTTKGNDGLTFRCMSGCGAAGDIFNAGYLLEGYPCSGPEFYSITLPYFAQKYEIEMPEIELNEEEIYEINTYRAYRLAAEYILNSPLNQKVSDELTRRCWSNETYRRVGAGTVSSFDDFWSHMKKQSGYNNEKFSVDFLHKIDLQRKDLFNENSMIFIIKDEHGQAVGFASRDLDYKPGSGKSKYTNSRTDLKGTGTACNIYRKSERLYNFHNVLLKHGKKPCPIYIMEGYGDVLSAVENGIDQCVALGGISFTEEQLHLLKRHNFHKYICCLDGDEAGRTKTVEILDRIIAGHKDIEMFVKIMPVGIDPDELLKEENGKEKFEKIKNQDAFSWRLDQFLDEENSDEICARIIPLIVSEPNKIKQEKMVKLLSERTNISHTSIEKEVERLQNDRETQKSLYREEIVSLMVSKLMKKNDTPENVIAEAQSALYELTRQYNEDHLSKDGTLSLIESQKKWQEEHGNEFMGYNFGPDFSQLSKALNGNWKGTFMLVGGKPNCGKTAFLTSLACRIAKHGSETENNTCVIYHTIDDTAAQMLPKFVCAAEGSKTLEINQVLTPGYYQSLGIDVVEKRNVGYSKIKDLVERGRLILKDSQDGNSLAFVESLIKYYTEEYPKRNIIYILDNFHKLQDLQNNAIGHEVYRSMSQRVKNIAGKYNTTIIATVEYTKTPYGEKPTNYNISSTVQLEYDGNVIMHLYNDLHDKKDRANDYHTVKYNNTITRLPRIELSIQKNKISSFKENLFFDFYPASSDFKEVPIETVISDRETKKNSGRDEAQEVFEN